MPGSQTGTKILCELCKKKFQSISSRNKHLRNVHKNNSQNSNKSSRIICPCCPEKQVSSFTSFSNLREHLIKIHDIKFEEKELQFDNIDLFNNWKENEEKKTKNFYCLHATTEGTNSKILYFECHRSNLSNYESKCSSRAPKTSGSIKINGVCPSRIRAEIHQSSKVLVTYIPTHVGHVCELRCQPFTKSEKRDIVEQLRAGVSNDKIIENARKTKNEDCSRLNLLTKKTLYYLAEKNNITRPKSIVNKTHNVAISMGFEAVTEQSPTKFLVHSQTRSQFNEVEVLCKDCECDSMRCSICNICIHYLKCNCYDAATRNKFCKHKHLVAMYLKKINCCKRSDDETNEDSDALHIHVPSTATPNEFQEEADLRNSSYSTKAYNKTDLENQCKELLDSLLSQCNNSDDYQRIINALTQLEAQFNSRDVSEVHSNKKRKLST